jgi:hypothetical protein
MFGLVATSDTVFFSASNALYSVPVAGGEATFIRDRFTLNQAAADATSVYVAEVLGKVLKFTPPEATPTEFAIGDKLMVRGLAVNTTDLFASFGDLSVVGNLTGGIVKIAKGGGTAQVIVKTAGLPDAVAADDSSVFWAEGPPVGTFGNGHIARADADGNHVTTLSNLNASALAVDATYLYALFDILSRIPKAGGVPETLASGFSGADVLRLEGGDAVWIDRYSKAMSDPTPSSVMAMCVQRPSTP